MKWYGEVKARVLDHVDARIEYAARLFRDHIRTQLVTRRSPPASDAGEYPHEETGHLRRNVQMEMDRTQHRARVGTNVVYGKYLEFGTRRMMSRPWLSKATREFGPTIRRILEAPVPGGR